jgi:hypothetical protein
MIKFLQCNIIPVLTFLTALFGAVAGYITILYYRNKIKLVSAEKDKAEAMQKSSEYAFHEYKEFLCDMRIKMESFEQLISSGLIPSTVSQVYQKSYLHKSERSLFDYRQEHYAEEKDAVCRLFFKSLIDLIAKQTPAGEKCNTKTYLLIDSGTTVFPIFKLLCDYYWDPYYHDILKNIEIITNNIPGISYIIDYGRRGDSRNAEMLYKCNAVPGIIEGKYSAILGIKSVRYINNTIQTIKKKIEQKQKAIFVGLVTGNYISLRDGILWRGYGHGMVKNAIIHNSEYVFCLSPLGKIFDLTAEDINKMIKPTSGKEYKKLTDIDENIDVNISGGDIDACREYFELTQEDCTEFKSIYDLFDDEKSIAQLVPNVYFSNDKKKKVFLVTTERNTGNNYDPRLIAYFAGIKNELSNLFSKEQLITEKFCPSLQSKKVIVESILFKTDEALLRYEFPHPELREEIRQEITMF